LTQQDNSGDYESELAVIIGKDCKNVSEAEAPDYILGYTASNDVSSRVVQLNQSQWCFSKGFDDSCPIGKINPIGQDYSLTYILRSGAGFTIFGSRCRKVANPRFEEQRSYARLFDRVSETTLFHTLN
jgi:hypothetical protein